MSVLQPTLPELGRIRAGDKQPVKGKKDVFRPNRLDRFRLTSQNPILLHKAVELGYGDEVIEWPDAPEGRQWQLYCTVEALPVYVPPMAAFSQYNELWAGAECTYRCDGQVVHRSAIGGIEEGMLCQCDTFDERVPVVTRVNVMLPDLPGLGVWRLNTQGYYAGSELQGIVQMLSAASARNTWIDAQLMITQRRQRKEGQTRVFPVITLQPVEMTPRQMLALQQPVPVKQIEMPSDDDVYLPPHSPETGEVLDRGKLLNRIVELRKEYGHPLKGFNEWIATHYAPAKTSADCTEEQLQTIIHILETDPYGMGADQPELGIKDDRTAAPF